MPATIWGNAGNTWTVAGNWSAGVPIAGDEAYLLSGKADVDPVDQSAINLLRLAIGNAYNGRIGDPSGDLIISADEVTIRTGAGGQDIYLDSGAIADHAEVRIKSDAAHAQQGIYLKATTTCPRMTIVRGNVILVSGTFTDVIMAWDGFGTAPHLTIAGATVTNLFGEQTYNGAGENGTVSNLYHLSGNLILSQSFVASNIWQRGGLIDDRTEAGTAICQVSGTSQFTAANNLLGKVYSDFRKIGNDAIVNLNNGLGNIDTTILYAEGGLPPLLYDPTPA